MSQKIKIGLQNQITVGMMKEAPLSLHALDFRPGQELGESSVTEEPWTLFCNLLTIGLGVSMFAINIASSVVSVCCYFQTA